MAAFMTWVKICGITNLEDALVAVEAGAYAVGFVFYEKSPRNVTDQQVAKIIQELPEQVEKVGVVVEDFTDGLTLPGNLTAVQWTLAAVPDNFAGFLSPPFARPFKTFLSFPAGSLDDKCVKQLSDGFARFTELSNNPSLMPAFNALFLDSGKVYNTGGTGNPFDWRKAGSLADQMREGAFKLVVAGGLTSENVGEAMGILHPWGVDVSSGVEARPGKKDPEKVRAFVKAVREADKTNSRN